MKESWKIREEKRREKIKIWIDTINFPSPLEFPKLCLVAEARLISSSDVVLNVCRRNI